MIVPDHARHPSHLAAHVLLSTHVVQRLQRPVTVAPQILKYRSDLAYDIIKINASKFSAADA